MQDLGNICAMHTFRVVRMIRSGMSDAKIADRLVTQLDVGTYELALECIRFAHAAITAGEYVNALGANAVIDPDRLPLRP